MGTYGDNETENGNDYNGGRPLPLAVANIPSLITIQVHAVVVMMMVLVTVKLSVFISVNIVDIVLCRFSFFILLSSCRSCQDWPWPYSLELCPVGEAVSAFRFGSLGLPPKPLHKNESSCTSVRVYASLMQVST